MMDFADEEKYLLSNEPIGAIIPISQLKEEYNSSSSPGFVPGIDYLVSKYHGGMRRVVGDGNCFYRAFLYGYLDQLLSLYITGDSTAEQEKNRIFCRLESSKDDLVKMGYSEIAIESFHDMILDLVSNLFSMTPTSLLAEFQGDGRADYYTWYMRCLTAGYMKMHAKRFLPFVIGDADVPDEALDPLDANADAKAVERLAIYCGREVEPMGKEVEQVMVMALCSYLGIQTELEYLDGRPFESELNVVMVLQDEDVSLVDCPFSVTLLYRPGHYDILYRNKPK